jgi:transcriptional regulator with XRE-family HTH domain
VDLVRFGLVIRALRRRRGWRQLDLAAAAGVSQGLISLIERGHGDRLSLRTLMRVAACLDARLVIELRWRGGELERLLDQDHGAVTAELARLLEAAGWLVRLEVTYSVYGERGSIDVLAWHADTRSLLVVEIKTEVTSGEATVRKLDEKERLASDVAVERFGWKPATVSRLLVVEDSSTARGRIEAAKELFRAAFPARAVKVRQWLRAPAGMLSGLMFLRNTNRGRTTAGRRGRHRVRPPAKVQTGALTNVVERSAGDTGVVPLGRILRNRT